MSGGPLILIAKIQNKNYRVTILNGTVVDFNSVYCYRGDLTNATGILTLFWTGSGRTLYWTGGGKKAPRVNSAI